MGKLSENVRGQELQLFICGSYKKQILPNQKNRKSSLKNGWLFVYLIQLTEGE